MWPMILDDLLQELAQDPWGRLLLRQLVVVGLKGMSLFLFTSARFAGILVIAPGLLGHAIPVAPRVCLVVLLSLIVASVLSGTSSDGAGIALPAYPSGADSNELSSSLVCLFISELFLGTVLGVGILTVMNGLLLGGEWILRETGLESGPALGLDGMRELSSGEAILQLTGIAVFLTLNPFGGIVLVIQTLLQSFDAIPLGSGLQISSVCALLAELVQQSMVLGTRIAMPMVAVMAVMHLTLAVIRRDGPAVFGSSSPVISMSISLLVLAMTVTALPDVVALAVSSMVQSLREIR